MVLTCKGCNKILSEVPPFELLCKSYTMCKDCTGKTTPILRILPDLDVIRELDGFDGEDGG